MIQLWHNKIHHLRNSHLHEVAIAVLLLLLITASVPHLGLPQTQIVSPQPDQTWVGQRIMMVRGFAEVHHAENDRARTVVGINIVTPVVRVDGNRVWVSSTGGDDVGWVNVKDVLLLSNAILYFNSVIEKNPRDWDPYLRRAEAEHALNQREAATTDYTKAIELHPTEAFLYLRRGRHYHTIKDCKNELQDYEEALRLVPTSARQGYNLRAELYSLESGVYSGCASVEYRNPTYAIATARHAISLDHSRPTLRTILAVAYASAEDLADAIKEQARALASPKFPPGYREEADRQLHRYKEAYSEKRKRNQ